VDRALGSSRDWWQHGTRSSSQEGAYDDTPPDHRLPQLLRACVTAAQAGTADAPWPETIEVASAASQPVDLTQDEPGVVLTETLAVVISPSRLLPVFRNLHHRTQDLILEQWRVLIDAIPLQMTAPAPDYMAAARAYASLRAAELAQCLEEKFIEGGNSPCSAGDLYLTRDDQYFYNFSYLCGEFNLGRDEAIASLRALGKMLEPTEAQLERLGGHELFSSLIGSVRSLDGDAVPQALAELLPLVDLPFSEVTDHLPRSLISRLAITAVARRLGFELRPNELLEIYEVFAILEQSNGDRKAFLDFLTNLYCFEVDAEEPGYQPSKEWQGHWCALRDYLGADRTRDFVLSLIPAYVKFSSMMGDEPFYRVGAAWQAACLDENRAAEWVVRMTTEHGVASPILAASLLSSSTPAKALARMAKAWRSKVAEVPIQSSWSREFTVLVLRFAITRQRSWLLDRLTDLYLRGGGYEAGETREVIEAILEGLLEEMELDGEEKERLENSGLHFELLPFDVNVFTGETVDASRWASPTSAYKYVRTLLRLEDRGLDYLASLVSERRVVALEKALRKLDFHTSVQQIVASCTAFEEEPEKALTLLLLLRESDGECPTAPWLERVNGLWSELGKEKACRLLWDLYRADQGDEYSLNPGIFWALRLVPDPSSVAQLAKAATEMVRRKPSFAIAALDTLDSISTRGALSAILQMRRRIRNRKVVKLINRTIDRIAEEEGLDRDVFLDYAVDTGDLEKDSSRLFDFGSHQVTLKLELDGRISTTVLDAKGRHLRSFPKTAKDADPTLYKEFQATKKLLVETISYQVRRLEQSMINGRLWRGKDFLEIYREHPVMAHLGKRLIWAKADKKMLPRDQFLITDDGYVNSKGVPFKVKDNDLLLIVHPLFFNDQVRDEWLDLLEKVSINQPFPQVDRQVYIPLPGELESRKTQRLVGLKSESSELYRVVKERGWSTDGGGPWEVGNATHSYRIYPSAAQTVHLDTNILGYDKQLTIVDIRFTNGEETALEITNVHPVVYSEAFRDLMLCFDGSAPEASAS